MQYRTFGSIHYPYIIKHIYIFDETSGKRPIRISASTAFSVFSQSVNRERLEDTICQLNPNTASNGEYHGVSDDSGFFYAGLTKKWSV